MKIKFEKREKISMSIEEFTRKYWKYYLMLESKFIKTINYVELDKENFCTFSNEYVLLIQAIGAELDDIFKILCDIYPIEENENDKSGKVDNDNKEKEILKYNPTIQMYADYILNKPSSINFPKNINIKEQKVKVVDYEIELQPFEGWNNTQNKSNQEENNQEENNQKDRPMQWWRAFTNIKHNRHTKFGDANQKNVLNILAALFFVEQICLKKIVSELSKNKKKDDAIIDCFDEGSKLFFLENWETEYKSGTLFYSVTKDLLS